MTTTIIEQLISWLRAQAKPEAHLRLDSRQVQPGDVFVACSGHSQDGYDFIGDALKRGAVAIIYDNQHSQPDISVPSYGLADLRSHLGEIGRASCRERV